MAMGTITVIFVLVATLHFLPGYAFSHYSDFYSLMGYLHLRKAVREQSSLLQFIINPFSQILFCDYHFGYYDMPGKGYNVVLNPLVKSNVDRLNPYEIICCQSNSPVFEVFTEEILPLIHIPFFLMTGSLQYGAVVLSNYSDAVRRNKNVLHWFAQDPIYTTTFEMNGYSGFPYGVFPWELETYAATLLKTIHKKHTIPLFLPLGENYPDRAVLKMTRTVENNLNSSQYYQSLAETEFVLSPRGDRPEWYRHWEAIGLGAIPISDLNRDLYEPMFQKNMIFVPNTTTMLKYLVNNTVNADTALLHENYKMPNRNLVTMSFWVRHVSQVVKKLGGSNVSGMFVRQNYDGTQRWIGGRLEKNKDEDGSGSTTTVSSDNDLTKSKGSINPESSSCNTGSIVTIAAISFALLIVLLIMVTWKLGVLNGRIGVAAGGPRAIEMSSNRMGKL